MLDGDQDRTIFIQHQATTHTVLCKESRSWSAESHVAWNPIHVGPWIPEEAFLCLQGLNIPIPRYLYGTMSLSLKTYFDSLDDAKHPECRNIKTIVLNLTVQAFKTLTVQTFNFNKNAPWTPPFSTPKPNDTNKNNKLSLLTATKSNY